MWALSPLAAPVEALEEILADVQTARPTSTASLTVGPMVGIDLAAVFSLDVSLFLNSWYNSPRRFRPHNVSRVVSPGNSEK